MRDGYREARYTLHILLPVQKGSSELSKEAIADYESHRVRAEYSGIKTSS